MKSVYKNNKYEVLLNPDSKEPYEVWNLEWKVKEQAFETLPSALSIATQMCEILESEMWKVNNLFVNPHAIEDSDDDFDVDYIFGQDIKEPEEGTKH